MLIIFLSQRHHGRGVVGVDGVLVQLVSLETFRVRTRHGFATVARRLPLRAPLRSLRSSNRLLAFFLPPLFDLCLLSLSRRSFSNSFDP